jgi:hypothetical protein
MILGTAHWLEHRVPAYQPAPETKHLDIEIQREREIHKAMTAEESLGKVQETMFRVTKASTSNKAARLGVLNLPDRKPIQTPHFLALASRGAVPHLTQDNVIKHTHISGVYMAVEDCTLHL